MFDRKFGYHVANVHEAVMNILTVKVSVTDPLIMYPTCDEYSTDKTVSDEL